MASAEVIVPAFRPEPIYTLDDSDLSNRRVCIIALKGAHLPALVGADIHVVEYESLGMPDLNTILQLRPRVVASLANHSSALLPYFFMSVGAAYMGWQNEATSLTV